MGNTFDVAFIRADSSINIGSGHIYRCLVLARALARKGIQTKFISKNLSGNFNDVVRSNSIEVIELNDTLSEIEDAAACTHYVKQYHSPLVILDNYYLGLEFEEAINKHCTLLVIDDLLNRKHNSHFHLDQNFRIDYGNHPAKLMNPNATHLLGPGFSLIRESFRQFINETTAKIGIRSILVFFGGSDPTGETLRFIKETKVLNISDIRVKIVTSSGNKYLPEIQNQDLPIWMELAIQPPEIAVLMKSCDVYFGSGGSITWERMLMGLPGYVVSVAENQIEMSEQLALADLQVYLGESRNINYRDAFTNILKTADSAQIQSQSTRIKTIVDGFGAERVIQKLFERVCK